MIWHIARKEFLVNALTYRFVAAVVVSLGVTCACAWALIQDYDQRLRTYNKDVNTHREQIDKILVYSQLKSWADRPPSQLSFVSLGNEWESGRSILVHHIDVPTEAVGSHRANPLLAVFADIDPALVIEVMISLMVLLFSYDSISGERERGTLMLLFTNSLSRFQLIFAKYLGGILTAGIPVITSLLLVIVMASGTGFIELTGDTLGRICLIALCAIVYISLIFLIGVVVSIWFKKSNSGLIVLFFIWIFIVVIIPDGSAYLASWLRPITSAHTIEAKRSDLENQFWREVYEYAKSNPRPRRFWDWDLIIGRSVWSGDLPYAFTCMFAPREIIEWYGKGTATGVKRKLKYAEWRWDIYQNYLNEQRDQAELAMFIARLSPAWLFSHAVEVLAGTDAEVQQDFLRQARSHRGDLLQYIEHRGGFQSLGYFTRLERTDLRPFHELLAIKEKNGIEAVADLAKPWTKNLKPLQGMPEFRYRPEKLHQSFYRAGFDISLLILANVVLFLIAYISFIRQDIQLK